MELTFVTKSGNIKSLNVVKIAKYFTWKKFKTKKINNK